MGDLLVIVALCGLATWRLTSLLHTEDAFEWLRKWVGIGHDDEGWPITYPDRFVARQLKCFWCLTLWVAGPVALLVIALARVRWQWWALLWAATSTVAIWLERQLMRSRAR